MGINANNSPLSIAKTFAYRQLCGKKQSKHIAIFKYYFDGTTDLIN